MNRHTWQKEAHACNGRSRHTRTRCGGWHLATWGQGWSLYPPLGPRRLLTLLRGQGDLAVTATLVQDGQLSWKAAGQFPGAPVPPLCLFTLEKHQHHLEKWFHWPCRSARCIPTREQPQACQQEARCASRTRPRDRRPCRNKKETAECPLGRINPEDVPSGRGQTQSTDDVVGVCDTLERRGGWDGAAFGATVPGTLDKLISAPSSIQEMMALRVTPTHASIPTAPPCIAGHHERTCWLLLLLIPFRTACCWNDC